MEHGRRIHLREGAVSASVWMLERTLYDFGVVRVVGSGSPLWAVIEDTRIDDAVKKPATPPSFSGRVWWHCDGPARVRETR